MRIEIETERIGEGEKDSEKEWQWLEREIEKRDRIDDRGIEEERKRKNQEKFRKALLWIFRDIFLGIN